MVKAGGKYGRSNLIKQLNEQSVLGAIFREGPISMPEFAEREASLLSLAGVSTTASVDPELVLLGGGICIDPHLLEPVRRTTKNPLAWPPRIERSPLGDRAPYSDALAVALRDGRDRLFSGHGRYETSGATSH